MFLLLGAFFIITSENLALKNKDNFEQFSSLYYSWFDNLFENGKTLTGYIIDSKWLPEIG